MKYVYTVGPLTIHSKERMTPQEVMDDLHSMKPTGFTADDMGLREARKCTTADVREATIL